MVKQGDNITTDIRLGSSQVGSVYLGSAKIYPGLMRTEAGVHYDTGADTYIGWDRYNIYYYRDILTWSNGTVTYENLRTVNTLTQANAYTEIDKLKTVGTAFWPSAWDKYRTDVYQTWRTRGDGYADWVGSPRDVPVLVESNAYTLGAYYHESSTPTVCTNYGVAPYETGYHRIMARSRIRFDGYAEVNDRYTESSWQIVATNVVACGKPTKPWITCPICGKLYQGLHICDGGIHWPICLVCQKAYDPNKPHLCNPSGEIIICSRCGEAYNAFEQHICSGSPIIQ